MGGPAVEAIQRLQEGNRRFVEGRGNLDAYLLAAQRSEAVSGQKPFAVVLGCSDSRVPVETVFDQGLGDLFVIRIAGNVVASSQVGSIEFAVERFGVRLVVVLGHSHCGAVEATLEEIQRPTQNRSRGLRSIVDRIRPSVEGFLDGGEIEDYATVLRRSVRANVRASASQLRFGSDLLEREVREGGLRVVGAEYSLETGLVEFFDGVP